MKDLYSELWENALCKTAVITSWSIWLVLWNSMQNVLIQELLLLPPLLFRLSQIYWNFHLVFISGLWCNTVENQRCYSYIVEKLRCCLPPLPTKSVLPLLLKCNRHYQYCILLNFLWQYTLFVFKWSSVQAFSICIF